MFEKIKCKLMSVMPCVKRVPPACIFVPALLLAAAFIIRLICGGGCVMCRFSGDAGLFPGSFLYTVGYAVRLVLCGIILASALFSYKVEKRIPAALFAAVLCCMMLFEYKLIFTMCRFFAASIMCLMCGAAAFISLLYQRGCAKSVSICTLLYMVMQAFFFVQVVSLLFCL